MSSSTSKTTATTPSWTMRGHTNRVKGVVHLPGGRRIITCSVDGSLRLWDLESGAQIGEDWKDESKAGVFSIALSPNNKTIASGSSDGTVRLWDVETRRVIAKWTGHTNVVCALCWSADGKRVVSGSWDGMARVWKVKSGRTVLRLKTGHAEVYAVMHSPDQTKIATGGWEEDAAKIWNAKTGKLITTLKHNWPVCSLAWTSDGKRFISASFDPIRIFDTTTWQEIAILQLEGQPSRVNAILDGRNWDNGHIDHTRVNAISLSRNDRLLASASWNDTARLWNLDTYLPAGPPLQHEDKVDCAAFSADAKLLVTGCQDKNVYVWDNHAILNEASLEDDRLHTGAKDRLAQKPSQGNSGIERTPRSSFSDRSFLEADATRCHDEFGGVDELPPRFFDDIQPDVDSSKMGGAHPHSSASALLAHLSSLLHRVRHGNAEATDLPQPPTSSGLHPQALLARLSSLIHRSPPENDAENEPQQPSTPSRLDTHALLARMSSFLRRSRLSTEEESEPRPTMPSGSSPDALIGRLSSLFRSQLKTNEEIELPHRSWRPRVVEVAPMRDREVLFVAPRSPPHRPHTQPDGNTTPRPTQSRLLLLLAHLVLFLCCASPQHIDDNAKPTQQQQGQSQDHVQAQASSSQT
ncbi:WD40-repeat-containing domain protein [Suillus clintonianus]|uniref:WD40-repeat-containing domain protein n=1 Tax=Suillus clintonianus TaxID=1904413 RepID=UPI001B85C4E0|nr:WD40-repeat-containing domain protein [Suillus clintonianus]KAG2145818.1 WD40-repeat-containing domain protein [Suillus clintonianus]